MQKRFVILSLFFVFASLLFIVGCREKTEPSATPPPTAPSLPAQPKDPAVAPPLTADGSLAAEPAAAVAMPEEKPMAYKEPQLAPRLMRGRNSQAAQAGGGSGAEAAKLTDALRKFRVKEKRVPDTLEELVAGGYIGSLPNPPAGMKFVIDAKKLEVKAETQQ